MNNINALFDRMDAWQHLANYQLERRADIFFSLYLPEVLEKKLGFPVKQELVPEFPVHIKTIYGYETDKSYKIDYVAFSEKLDKAVFVELKTDGTSRRLEQDEYLCKAKEAGFNALLKGLKTIFKVTTSKRKYFQLFELLEKAELISIPDEVKAIMNRPNLQGLTELISEIQPIKVPSELHIVYIQPTIESDDSFPDCISTHITFNQFAEVVKSYDDPISQRFAISLGKWAKRKPGERV